MRQTPSRSTFLLVKKIGIQSRQCIVRPLYAFSVHLVKLTVIPISTVSSVRTYQDEQSQQSTYDKISNELH